MKEFMIEREPIHSKYKRYQAKWFKKNTKYAAFGQICAEKKPQYNSSFDDGLTQAGNNFKSLISDIKNLF